MAMVLFVYYVDHDGSDEKLEAPNSQTKSNRIWDHHYICLAHNHCGHQLESNRIYFTFYITVVLGCWELDIK